MPEDNCNIKNENELTNEELLRLIKQFAILGITKIRLTGGEPLIRKNIVDLIKNIKNIKGIEEISLTTNGILLKNNIKALAENGLTRVNISLDSMNEDVFKFITKTGNLNDVLTSIDLCLQNNVKVKINTVIIDGVNNNEIMDFVNLTEKKQVDVRFIELMPIGAGKSYKGISNDDILNLIRENNKEFAMEEQKETDGPATYIKLKNAFGKVGFISAISNCFCSGCNRIRITSDGQLKQCLNWNTGINLKKILLNSSDEELNRIIKETIFDKPEKHYFNKDNINEETKFMHEIGG